MGFFLQTAIQRPPSNYSPEVISLPSPNSSSQGPPQVNMKLVTLVWPDSSLNMITRVAQSWEASHIMKITWVWSYSPTNLEHFSIKNQPWLCFKVSVKLSPGQTLKIQTVSSFSSLVLGGWVNRRKKILRRWNSSSQFEKCWKRTNFWENFKMEPRLKIKFCLN